MGGLGLHSLHVQRVLHALPEYSTRTIERAIACMRLSMIRNQHSSDWHNLTWTLKKRDVHTQCARAHTHTHTHTHTHARCTHDDLSESVVEFFLREAVHQGRVLRLDGRYCRAASHAPVGSVARAFVRGAVAHRCSSIFPFRVKCVVSAFS